MASNAATSPELRELAQYLSGASGIELDESKGYLFEARLRKIADDNGCATLGGLLDKSRRDATGKLRGQLVDAVSTNETYFFREPQQFALLAHKIIPEHFGTTNQKRCRIWCAAASTGQEIYSVAITLKEMLGSLNSFDLQILGTDISASVLEKASRGHYTQLEVSRGLSPERIKRFFVPAGSHFAISDELRSLATFRRHNLLDPATTLGTFDIVLCRNVAIYFSPANRTKLFAHIAGRMHRHGALIVSMTETLGSNPHPFVRSEFRGVTYYSMP